VALALAVVLVVNHDFAVTRDRDELVALVGSRSVCRWRSEPRRSTSIRSWLATAVLDAAPPMWNVPHRQLRPRLTDRLRGDDAHRFADVDRNAAAEDRGRSTSRTDHDASRM
jgi:hypothetical protein